MYSRLEINIRGLSAKQVARRLRFLASIIETVNENPEAEWIDLVEEHENFAEFLLGICYFCDDEEKNIYTGTCFFPHVIKDEEGCSVAVVSQLRDWVDSGEPAENVIR